MSENNGQPARGADSPGDRLSRLSQASLRINESAVATHLPQVRELEGQFSEAGIGPIISAFGSGVPVELAGQAIAHAPMRG
ncbi:MAG: hypothetical protein OXE17_05690 [Chloroflexi bacterium]|nr:hypothetical protein [Chloroflexota bacterium]